jgi:hypothetical protein
VEISPDVSGVFSTWLVEEGGQHARENPGRSLSTMLLPQAVERKQSGKATPGKSNCVPVPLVVSLNARCR